MPEAVSLYQITPETRLLYRARMDRDPWVFSEFVCKHVAKAVPRIHRPLLYLYTRQADLLCALLDDPAYEGEITRQVREDFVRKGIDWRNPAHLPLVRQRLRKQNHRLPRGVGKALAVDTPIPTPDGWKTQGSLRRGDLVYSGDGKPTSVVAVTEVWNDRPCYRVEFSDHESIVCDAEHLWVVSDRFASKKQNPKARRTADMAPRVILTERRGIIERRYTLPITLPIEGTPRHLPIDPYTLGVWLGDGTSDCGQFTSADPQIANEVASVGYEIRKSRSARYRWGVIGLKVQLRSMNVLGNKHIPDIYLRAPIHERLALLQGLMDTDGSTSAKGACEITLKSGLLVEDTQELLASLGIKFGIAERYVKLDGKICGPYTRISFQAFNDLPVFRLKRKLDRLSAAPQIIRRSRTRMVSSIIPVKSVPVRCIQVENPTGIYLAGRKMIPTHNSTFADDGDLWEGVKDPNITIFLGSKSDDYAEKRIIAIGEIVKSPEFAFWYPERVPLDMKSDVTQGAIKLRGRTISNVEATIEGHGITSHVTGLHFRKVRSDDIVGTESGQASEEDAIGFIANIDGISVREVFGGTDRLHIGTVTGENDDHSMLAENPDVLSIVMPIERHTGGTTLENINDDGELTMPEPGWFDRESVNKIKAEAKANPKHGLMWLMQNFYMLAHKSGITTFTQQTMNAAKFLWHTDPETHVRYILRPKRGKQNTPRRIIKDAHGHERTIPVIARDWFVLDLRKLPRSAFAWAMDQAVSLQGDPWSMTLVCMDWEGVIYLLANISDVGYAAQIDNILPFDKLAQRDFHCPGKPGTVGLDANATQGMTTEWLTRDADFRDVARRVKELRSNSESKEAQIRRWLQGRMMSGDTYYNPLLLEFENEALKWRPRKPDGSVNKRAIDNNLDSAWMASTLPHRPPSPTEIDEDTFESLTDFERYREGVDPLTGISTDDWTGQMWRGAA